MKTFFTVHALAQNNNGEILILQRAEERTDPGTWNCVTGFVRDNESAEDAALRELKEETNLTGTVVKTSKPFWKDYGDTRWVVVASLIKIKDTPKLKIDPKESQDFRWIKPDDKIVNESIGLKTSLIELGLII